MEHTVPELGAVTMEMRLLVTDYSFEVQNLTGSMSIDWVLTFTSTLFGVLESEIFLLWPGLVARARFERFHFFLHRYGTGSESILCPRKVPTHASYCLSHRAVQ